MPFFGSSPTPQQGGSETAQLVPKKTPTLRFFYFYINQRYWEMTGSNAQEDQNRPPHRYRFQSKYRHYCNHHVNHPDWEEPIYTARWNMKPRDRILWFC